MDRISFRLLVALGTLVLALQASLPWVGAAAAHRLDGDPLLLTAGAVFVVGAITLLVAYSTGVRSLSHHERLHAAVEQAREDYVRLFHASPEGIFSADADFAFEVLNLSGARALGASEPSALVGRRLPSLCADPETGHSLLRQLRADGQARQAVIQLRTRPDGRTHWIELTCQPRRTMEGTLTGVDGVFRDVTDRVEAEAKAHERFDKLQSAYLELGRVNRHLALLEEVSQWEGDAALRDEEIALGVLRSLLAVGQAEAGAAFVLDLDGTARTVATAGLPAAAKRRGVSIPAALAPVLAGGRAAERIPLRGAIGTGLLGRKNTLTTGHALGCRERGEVIGVFELYGRAERLPDEELLRALAALAAPCLARLRAV